MVPRGLQMENEKVKWKSILPFLWKVTLPHDKNCQGATPMSLEGAK